MPEEGSTAEEDAPVEQSANDEEDEEDSEDVPSGNAEAQCKSHFAGGVPPSNIKSPAKGSVFVPLCHTNGRQSFFYTVYDSSMLHGVLTATRLSAKNLALAKGAPDW